MNILFETERCIIRELEETDIEGMFTLDSNPEVHRFLGNTPIKTKEEALKMIRHVRQQYIDNGIGRLAIIEKTSGAFMGWTGLKLEKGVRADREYYDLGYRLLQKYWGKGIATETAIASLQYGFETLQLEEINAAADVDHIASNSILKKVGMQFVETFLFEGTPHNWYSIKKEG